MNTYSMGVSSKLPDDTCFEACVRKWYGGMVRGASEAQVVQGPTQGRLQTWCAADGYWKVSNAEDPEDAI